MVTELFDTQPQLLKAFRNTCIAMLSVNTLVLLVTGYFVCLNLRMKPTLFTVLLVSLIVASILLGSIEYIIIILATESNAAEINLRAYDFFFSNCMMGITILSDF
jgi:hypothetical protein